MPNTVSRAVGNGDLRSFGNGFHNPRGVNNGEGRYFDQDRRRGGIGVGIIPFFPFAYGSGYDGTYENGYGPYDPTIGQEQQPGPYADAQPYGASPYGPPMAGPQIMPLPNSSYIPGPYTPGATPSMAADATTQAAPMPPVTIVLRNGHQSQVQNFAIVNGMFWDLSKQPAHKIRISDIDLAASQKATESNGGEFPDLNGNSEDAAQ